MYKECKSLKEVAKVDASSKNRLNECDGGGDSFLPVVAVILILPLNSSSGCHTEALHIRPKMCHVEDRVLFLSGGTHEPRPRVSCECE